MDLMLWRYYDAVYWRRCRWNVPAKASIDAATLTANSKKWIQFKLVYIDNDATNGAITSMAIDNFIVRGVAQPTLTVSYAVEPEDACKFDWYDLNNGRLNPAPADNKLVKGYGEVREQVRFWGFKSGYLWKSWKESGATDQQLPYTTVTSDESHTAFFLTEADKLITLTVYPSGAGKILKDGAEVTELLAASGDEFTLTSDANPGYEFVGWEPSGEASQKLTYSVAESATITAHFKPLEQCKVAVTVTAKGVVPDAQGEPVEFDGPAAGAKVEVFKLPTRNMEALTNAEANGVANFVLGAGDYVVRVTYPNFTQQTKELKIESGAASQNLTFELTQELVLHPLTVTVHDVDGKPIDRATVECGSYSGKTDASGVVKLNVPYGRLEYRVVAAGYLATNGLYTVVRGNNTLSVVLVAASADVNFTVVTKKDPTVPVEGALIFLYGDRVLTDPHGKATISVAAGTYSFTVQKAGFVDYSASGLLVEEGTKDVTVELIALCAVTYGKPDNGRIEVKSASEELVPTGTIVVEGTKLTITAIGDEGYEVESLKVNSVDFTSGAVYTVDGDVNIEATFRKRTYAITFVVSDASGVVEGAEVKVGGETKSTGADGRVVFDLANGDYSYTVVKADYKDAAGSFTVADAAQEVQVTLEEVVTPPTPEKFKVTIAVLQHGRITATPSEAEAGAAVTLEVLPDDGYRQKDGSLRVTSADGQPVSVANSKFTMPASDVTVTAEFEKVTAPTPVKFNVTIADLQHGRITATPTEAEAGATVTLEVLPDDGYRQKDGSLRVTSADGQPVSVANSKFTMPASNVTVAAEFEKVTPVEVSTLAVRVSPNPCATVLRVESEQPVQRYVLHSLEGRVVAEGVAVAREWAIDMSQLPAGIYLLRCESAVGVQVVRVVKE